MIENLDESTRRDVHCLRIMLEGKSAHNTIEERDECIDRLKYGIAEIVISILLSEDKEKLDYFIKNNK